MEQNRTLWTAGFFNERFPAPISPLGWSLLGPLIEDLALREPLRYLGYPHADRIPLTRLWHGHPYSNALVFHILYKVFPDLLLPEDVCRYFPNGDTTLRQRAPYPRSMLDPRLLFSLARAFLADPFNFSPFHNYRVWAHYTRAHDRRVAMIRARFDALKHAAPVAIFDALSETERAHRALLRIHRWSLTHADVTYGLLKRLVRAGIDPTRAGELTARLVAGVPNKTVEVDAALCRLATDGDTAALDPFLAEHGHRSFSLDIAVPTFADDPSQLAPLLGADEGGQTKDDHWSSVFRPPLPVYTWLFNIVRDLARAYVGLREDQRYYWQKSLALSRQLYLMLADRLVADGVIENRDLIFYATHTELVDYFQGQLERWELERAIRARHQEWGEYQREFERSPSDSYPAFLLDDEPLVSAQSNQRVWQGRAISPGKARGTARIVQAASGLARIRRGEILVAPSTDPAWTPVFGRISGLVLERGGVLSHGAVVAREYRVPAVAGIANIVKEIAEGELIEVDGDRGIVARVE